MEWPRGCVGWAGRPVRAAEKKREGFPLDLLIKGPAAPGSPFKVQRALGQTPLGHGEPAPPCVDSNRSGPEMRAYVQTSKMAPSTATPGKIVGELVAKLLITHPKEMNRVAPGFQGCSIKGEPWQ